MDSSGGAGDDITVSWSSEDDAAKGRADSEPGRSTQDKHPGQCGPVSILLVSMKNVAQVIWLLSLKFRRRKTKAEGPCRLPHT